MDFNDKTTIILPIKLKTELKIMCALTNRRMSDFIRIAVQDKINELKASGALKTE